MCIISTQHPIDGVTYGVLGVTGLLYPPHNPKSKLKEQRSESGLLAEKPGQDHTPQTEPLCRCNLKREALPGASKCPSICDQGICNRVKTTRERWCDLVKRWRVRRGAEG